MNIGIIGSGNVGGTLGTRWAKGGHHVTFGSRDPGAGDGGGSIGTRHDFASACRRRYLERA